MKYCCPDFKHHVEHEDIHWDENGKFSNYAIYGDKHIFDILHCPFCGQKLEEEVK